LVDLRYRRLLLNNHLLQSVDLFCEFGNRCHDI
jgi:hypothetical protein